MFIDVVLAYVDHPNEFAMPDLLGDVHKTTCVRVAYL